jgi:hypothetical protein
MLGLMAVHATAQGPPIGIRPIRRWLDGRGYRQAMSRSCARPGCSTQASATLTYDYGNRSAWLDRLAAEDHPMTHDLCDRHAGSLSVPRGWHLADRRVVAPLFREETSLAS